jgi:hypothetical protein
MSAVAGLSTGFYFDHRKPASYRRQHPHDTGKGGKPAGSFEPARRTAGRGLERVESRVPTTRRQRTSWRPPDRRIPWHLLGRLFPQHPGTPLGDGVGRGPVPVAFEQGQELQLSDASLSPVSAPPVLRSVSRLNVNFRFSIRFFFISLLLFRATCCRLGSPSSWPISVAESHGTHLA